MSRVFALRTMLRQTPNRLLLEFFRRLGHRVTGDLLGHEYDIEPFVELIERASVDERDRIESQLQQVFELACEPGVRVMVESASLAGLNFGPQLPDGNCYEKAMWTWLNHPTIAERALQLAQVERVSLWRIRHGLPNVSADLSSKTIAEMEQGIAGLLTQFQGRGRHCTIDPMVRGSVTYLFCYPDDYVRSLSCHDDAGRLFPTSIRSTFQMVFAYDQLEGTLRLHARGSLALKQALEQLFCSLILRQRIDQAESAIFALDHLKQRAPLLVDPADGMTASIRAFRFECCDSERALVLRADPSLGRDDIYTMLEQMLDHRQISLANLRVISTTLHFSFAGWQKRTSSTTVTLAHPNRSDLPKQPPDRLQLIDKYLKRWGIYAERKRSVAHAPAAESSKPTDRLAAFR